MPRKIDLTYVLTTKNRLLYLKETMARLIANIEDCEEIVVVDGGSTDGTIEYLADLYNQGKIHQFVSEPDSDEAIGYNRAILMAQGEVVVMLTDDDAFYYPAIQECKSFLLKHKDVDVLASSTAGLGFDGSHAILEDIIMSYHTEDSFRTWAVSRVGRSTNLSGAGLFMRRSAIPATGLFTPGYLFTDLEFSLRITRNKNLNIVFYTSPTSVNIQHNDSKSVRFISRAPQELRRLLGFYDCIRPPGWCYEIIYSIKKSWINWTASKILYLSRVTIKDPAYLINAILKLIKRKKIKEYSIRSDDIASLFNIAEEWLKRANEKKGVFLLDKRVKGI